MRVKKPMATVEERIDGGVTCKRYRCERDRRRRRERESTLRIAVLTIGGGAENCKEPQSNQHFSSRFKLRTDECQSDSVWSNCLGPV